MQNWAPFLKRWLHAVNFPFALGRNVRQGHRKRRLNQGCSATLLPSGVAYLQTDVQNEGTACALISEIPIMLLIGYQFLPSNL